MKALPIIAAVLCASSALAQTNAVQVRDAWSRPAAAGTTGAGYMILSNRGSKPDALVRVESPWAERVEMHSSTMNGGVMRMAKQARIELPAGGQVAFAPGSYHLMLIKLARPLKTGDRVPATLTFASGAQVKTEFGVGTGFGPPAGSAHGGMHMKR
ncbi:copper chaperone PCu(A)C [Phenylobacterium deserti]|uniref:Copper chaperone PCu(A)C n=1 Tax=Phenylobacterium deserti TaxID=1914756 RepID=A0A328ARQ7_9CAUL|nr:copper chaperone PCu(A)C [Phenylobacterium deserti]RAK57733.1 copper chaperone PCu(A)C [Phenylobacterium deserti]